MKKTMAIALLLSTSLAVSGGMPASAKTFTDTPIVQGQSYDGLVYRDSQDGDTSDTYLFHSPCRGMLTATATIDENYKMKLTCKTLSGSTRFSKTFAFSGSQSSSLSIDDYYIIVDSAYTSKQSYSLQFSFVPFSHKAPKLVSNKTGCLKILYPKYDVVSAYDVRYKTDGDSSWTTTSVTTTKNLNKTLTGLKSGKTYSVQVRTVVTDDYDTYYSNWTDTKTVTVK